MTPPVQASNPVVIGGVGGAGTRVFRSIAELAGYSMLVAPWPIRRSRPELHDNAPLRRLFYGRWIDPYLEGRLNSFQLRRMGASLRFWLWLSGPLTYQRGKWGWKNPRTAFLIPFLHELYPGMRYIHVIRDGRDHAFHPRFTYWSHHASLGIPDDVANRDELRRAAHWAYLNDLAERNGRELLGDRYLQVRLEDLCRDPATGARQVLQFLGVDDPAIVDEAAELVTTPASLGRWHGEDSESIAGVEELIGEALEYYGYALSAGAGG